MNRRSFITKALAGLAAVPLIGKLAQAVERDYHKSIPTIYGSLPLTRAVYTPHFHIATVTIADGPMSPPKSFRVSDEHGDHEFEVTRMRKGRGRTELTGVIYHCLDAETCKIGCPVTLYQERVMFGYAQGKATV